MKVPIGEWIIEFLAKRAILIRLIAKLGIVLFIVCYIYFFVRIGFRISGTSEYGPFATVLYGLICVIAVVVFHFFYFLGGDVDVKWIGFFIGLAVGGTIIGLTAGFLQSIVGYIIGGILGIALITLTLRTYFKPNAQL